MARYPGARWRPLPENRTEPRITPTQVIVHSAVDAPGPTSLYGFFARSDVHVESHFFVRFDGSIEQYIDTDRQADANRKANWRAISIETEDDGDPDNTRWSPEQVAAILDLIRWAHETHGVPLETCSTWDAPGIGFHSMFGAPSEWTPSAGKTCPGVIRIDQFWQEIIPALTTPEVPPMFNNAEDARRWVADQYRNIAGREPESKETVDIWAYVCMVNPNRSPLDLMSALLRERRIVSDREHA